MATKKQAAKKTAAPKKAAAPKSAGYMVDGGPDAPPIDETPTVIAGVELDPLTNELRAIRRARDIGLGLLEVLVIAVIVAVVILLIAVF